MEKEAAGVGWSGKSMDGFEDDAQDLVLDSSVDHRGEVPIRSKTGSWRAALFIIVIEFSERLCYFGLSTNLIIYLTKVLQKELKTAAKNVNYWTGVTTMLPLLGGFVADSYLGRFSTVLVSSTIYLLGLGLLTMSEFIPSLKPQSSLKHHELLFFMAMYLVSIGSGGHKPALESFGANQFDSNHQEERKKKMSYFNWWNAALCGGLVLGVTVIVYIQDYVGWGVADIVLTVPMVIGLVVLFHGRRYYRYRLPVGSPLTPMVQVIVAAFAKRHLSLPSNTEDLYEIKKLDKRLLCHTNRLKFLDKAAIIEVKDDEAGVCLEPRNRWRLATVTQVEELKLLLGVVPMWLATLGFGLCLAQGSTFFIKQCSVMDRTIFNGFEIPPASIYSLAAVSMIISVSIYDKIIVPLFRRITGNERGISITRRIGTGMVFSTLAVAIAAATERKRLEAVQSRMVPMNVFWLAPQFLILGFGDGFALVGLQEYFYEQVPEGMRSLGIAFYLSVIGAANFLSGVLITVVDKVTGRDGQGKSWFAKDLNNSRLDYFYWLLTVISGVNLCVYVFVGWKCCRKSAQKVANSESKESQEGAAC